MPVGRDMPHFLATIRLPGEGEITDEGGDTSPPCYCLPC
jgi:hypothetical protein